MFWQKRSSPDEKIQTETLKLSGMHCVSCALNIDGELEDTAGVKSATTSYAKGKTEVKFDPDEINLQQIKNIIEELGYGVE